MSIQDKKLQLEDTMLKICKGLHDKLISFSDVSGLSIEELWNLLLYEIPDEALKEFAMMANPIEIEMAPDLELVSEGMAEAFGMTVLGMSVLMNDIMEKTLAVNKRKVDHAS